MGNVDETTPPGTDAAVPKPQNVAVPPPQSFIKSMKNTLKETLFPDDPFRPLKNPNLTRRRKAVLTLQYMFPILEWGPGYSFRFFKSDLIAGITIASLAIPQGISYAKLANLPPILGLYSSFVPPLIYAVMGSSRDVAVGTVAVGSLLMGSMLRNAVSPQQDPKLYLHLAFTATFFAGVFQAALGIFRLGFIVDFLSHATIVGFMGGAATVVSLQQLKGFLGLDKFTQQTDVFSVMHSVFSQTHVWNWESGVMGFLFLVFILASRYFSKKKPKLFWVSAMAPLTSVILASAVVYCTHAHKHGIQVIGLLEKGINPPSLMDLNFNSRYLPTLIKTGIVTGIIALAEGIAAGRSFAMFKNYHIDGNKEMIAFGMMNIAGSCTSSYLTSGPFSRSAVNFNAGCKTAVSNIVMAVAVMMTLLFLTPLFYYTPLVVLSSIIVAAMLGLIDYAAAIHLWHVDKFDFFICIGAYLGVVFADIEVGLVLAVGLSILRVLLFVSRPRTTILGHIPNSKIYRSIDQYRLAVPVPGIVILSINGPIYFANSNYLRERISRCVEDEEEKIKAQGETELHHLILDMSAIGNIDTSGITMLEEVKKVVERKGLKFLLANPGAEVMKKLSKADFVGTTGVYLTVGDAVEACDLALTASSYSMANV